MNSNDRLIDEDIPHRLQSVPFKISSHNLELEGVDPQITNPSVDSISIRHPKEAIADIIGNASLDYLEYLSDINAADQYPIKSIEHDSEATPTQIEIIPKQESLYSWVYQVKDKINGYHNNLLNKIINTLNDPHIDPSEALALEGCISFLPDEQKAYLVEYVLIYNNQKIPNSNNNSRSFIKKIIVQQIQYIPEEERSKFISDILKGIKPTDESLIYEYNVIEQIQYIPEEERSKFIEDILKGQEYPGLDLESRNYTINQVSNLPEEERSKFIEDILKGQEYPDLDITAIKLAIKQIRFLPEAERSKFIEDILKGESYSSDLYYVYERRAIEEIRFLPEAERSKFISDILNNKYPHLPPECKQIAIQQIQCIPEGERSKFIEDILKGEEYQDLNPRDAQMAIQQIRFLPEDDGTILITNILDNKYYGIDTFLRKKSINQILYAPGDEMFSIQEEDKPDYATKYGKDIAIQQIQYLKEDQKIFLMKILLEREEYPSLSQDAKQVMVNHIYCLPNNLKIDFLEYILKDNIKYGSNFGVKQMAIRQIRYLPEEDRSIFITNILTDAYSDFDTNLKREAMQQIKYLAEEDMVKLLDMSLRSRFFYLNSILQIEAISCILLIPEDKKFIFFSDILSNKYHNLERSAKYFLVGEIHYMHPDQRSKLYKLALDQGLITQEDFEARIKEAEAVLTTTSPLHEIAEQDRIVQLFKTGSETFILPIPNMEEIEASVRIINYPSFLAWLKAATAIDTWKELGFDYIPIEPILDFNSSNNIKVAITTTNLRGASLAKSIDLYSTQVQQQILKTRALLEKTLEHKLSIIHGHTHYHNFVLVPQLDSNNQPDPSKMPRIYVIDFDKAREV